MSSACINQVKIEGSSMCSIIVIIQWYSNTASDVRVGVEKGSKDSFILQIISFVFPMNYQLTY